MLKKTTLLILATCTLSACVSLSEHDDLKNKYKLLQRSNAYLNSEKSDLRASKSKLKNELQLLQSNYDDLEKQQVILQSNYDTLSSQSSKKLVEQAEMLVQEKLRLEALQGELDERAAEVNKLQTLIKAKESQMLALKTTISKALHNFEGKGLTVVQEHGKIYVSMENKLLFKSGSWAVGSQGQIAVEQLASVLTENTDINVLIEGHTDNVPYNGSVLIDNWDLSVKRSTAIVRVLQGKGVNPMQITAAGRSEYHPITGNDSIDAKAKNRRIEIILTPNLDEITKLLQEESE